MKILALVLLLLCLVTPAQAAEKVPFPGGFFTTYAYELLGDAAYADLDFCGPAYGWQPAEDQLKGFKNYLNDRFAEETVASGVTKYGMRDGTFFLLDEERFAPYVAVVLSYDRSASFAYVTPMPTMIPIFPEDAPSPTPALHDPAMVRALPTQTVTTVKERVSSCVCGINGETYSARSAIVTTNADNVPSVVFFLDMPASSPTYVLWVMLSGLDLHDPPLKRAITVTNRLQYRRVTTVEKAALLAFGLNQYSHVDENDPSYGKVIYIVREVEPGLYVIRGEMGVASKTGADLTDEMFPRIEQSYARFEVYYTLQNGQIHLLDHAGQAKDPFEGKATATPVASPTPAPIPMPIPIPSATSAPTQTPPPASTFTPAPIAAMPTSTVVPSTESALPVVSTARAANSCTLWVNGKQTELILDDLYFRRHNDVFYGKPYLRLVYEMPNRKSYNNILIDILLDSEFSIACKEETVALNSIFVPALDDRAVVGYYISSEKIGYGDGMLQYRIVSTGSGTYEIIGTIKDPYCEEFTTYKYGEPPIAFEADFHASFGWSNGVLTRGTAEQTGSVSAQAPATANPAYVPPAYTPPEPEKRRCYACYGSGDCQTCYGFGDCNWCHGDGINSITMTRCNKCIGNGRCQDCGGNGRCNECNGLGEK